MTLYDATANRDLFDYFEHSVPAAIGTLDSAGSCSSSACTAHTREVRGSPTGHLTIGHTYEFSYAVFISDGNSRQSVNGRGHAELYLNDFDGNNTQPQVILFQDGFEAGDSSAWGGMVP